MCAIDRAATRRTGRERSRRWAALTLALCALALWTVPLALAADGAADPVRRETPLPSPEDIGPPVYSSLGDMPTSPPANPQVGDSWVWWLWVHNPMPPHFAQRVCTVRGMSEHAYVVVDDAQWGVNMDQSDVDAILERWENSTIGPYPDQGIYDLNSQIFGVPPDELDNDPRIYIMWFDFGISSDGFFFWFDEYPDGMFPPYRSNECEVLYMNCANGQNPQGDYMLSVIAHEFEHMIHWKYDEDEDSWVNEGMAELAMWFYGRPDVISAFNSAPDNSLIVWNGNWADYIKTYLWSLYFMERYGGEPAVYDVVHQAGNSIAGYEAVLDAHGYAENFADVFADWTVANFLDDPTIGDGRFGYLGDDLPNFNVMGTYTSYPVPNTTRTVSPWAADYYRFRNFGALSAVELGFDGSDNNVFAVWGLVLRGTGEVDVLRMTLDAGTQSGTLPVVGLTHPDDEVILVVAGISSTGTPTYVFRAEPASAAVGEPVLAGAGQGGPWRLEAFPNPSRGAMSLTLAGSGERPALGIFDAGGRLLRALGPVTGERAQWDGRDARGRRVSPGVYYARALGEGRSEPKTLLIVR